MLNKRLICIFVLILLICPSAFAYNYKYKLYDPNTNKSYSAAMMTITVSEDSYYLGFMDSGIICKIVSAETKDGGLIGGKCVDIDNRNVLYDWKELSANTFYPEVISIIEERKQQNCYLIDNMGLINKTTEILNQSTAKQAETSVISDNTVKKSSSPFARPRPGISGIQKGSYTANPDIDTSENDYVKYLQKHIKMNWKPPKDDIAKNTVALIKIAKNGRLISCEIFKSSGNQKADEAAVKAVQLAAPFKPLPANFKVQSVDVIFTFDYRVWGK